MEKWGRVDCSQLEAFANAMKKLSDQEIDKLCVVCSKALAARLLALVIPKTPVGKYPRSSGQKGGTLRRGWGAKTGSTAAQYASGMSVQKVGSDYIIEIVNPVEYASYVEYGHRTKAGGWVDGQKMLTISEERLKAQAPSVIEKLVMQKLREVCDG